MFLRLVWLSFLRQRRRKLLAGLALMMGITVTTAMMVVAADIGEKMSRELRSFGANLVIYPQEDTLDVRIGGVDLKPISAGAFLDESQLPKIKGIFWRNNILGFTPLLPLPISVATAPEGEPVKAELIGTYFDKKLRLGKEEFRTGVRTTHPWWRVRGSWPSDESSDVLLGEQLAAGLQVGVGSQVRVADRRLTVAGILSSGGAEDRAVVAPLALAQEIAGRKNAVRRVLVSALTKPEDAFARRDPAAMTPEQFDRWYCSPYANSIALQLQEAIPGSHAEQIRQVAQNEGTVLSRLQGLMLLVTLAALLASALAVSAAMATAIFERRREVGLMKALGASRAAVAALFFAEAGALALLGGGAGYLLGVVLAQQVALSIFSSTAVIHPILFPLVMGIAVLVAVAGSAAAIRRAARLDPAIVLRGEG